MDVLYTAFVRDGKLTVRHRKGELALAPAAADEFAAPPESLFTTLRYTRNDQKEITGFTVSTPRARNLRFARVALTRP